MNRKRFTTAFVAVTMLVAMMVMASLMTSNPAIASATVTIIEQTTNAQCDATMTTAKNTVELTAAQQAIADPKDNGAGDLLICPLAGTADNMVSAINKKAAPNTGGLRVICMTAAIQASTS